MYDILEHFIRNSLLMKVDLLLLLNTENYQWTLEIGKVITCIRPKIPYDRTLTWCVV